MPSTRSPAALRLVAALASAGALLTACDRPAPAEATPTDASPVEGAAKPDTMTAAGTRWTHLATAVASTCGARDSGWIYCTASSITPVARDTSGRLRAFNPPPGGVAAFTNAASDSPCVLGLDGIVQCWSGDGWRAPFTEDHRFARLAGGSREGCALTAAGAPWCWWWEGGPRNQTFVLTAITGAPPLVEIEYGYYFACGLTRDGAAYCWTLGPVRATTGQLGDGLVEGRTTAAPVKSDLRFASLALGVMHACGLTAAGEAWCWGSNMGNALGVPREPARDGCGVGTVAAAAPYSWATHWCTTPQRVETDLRFRALAASAERTCGLTADGRAYCWGANRERALGVATVADGTCRLLGPLSEATPCTPRPVAVEGDLRFAALVPDRGGYHQCAVGLDGRASCWGAVDPTGRPTAPYEMDDGTRSPSSARPIALPEPR